MLIEASTSTSAPPAISKMNSTGSVRWSLAREFLRAVSTRAATISSFSRKRATSTSCTQVSLMIMSLV